MGNEYIDKDKLLIDIRKMTMSQMMKYPVITTIKEEVVVNIEDMARWFYDLGREYGKEKEFEEVFEEWSRNEK